MKKISIVVPVFNESTFVYTAFEAIEKEFANSAIDYEVIFVDDASKDDSYQHLGVLAQKNSKVKVVRFLSNCGAHMAIRAGLELATGDMGVFMACDLQDPPSVIPKMIEKLDDNVDIVIAERANRDDSYFSKMGSKLFFSIMRKMISKKIPGAGASMYLMGKRAMMAITAYPEINLTLEGVFILNNFESTSVSYDRVARTQGSSKWTLSKKLKVFGDFFVAYSYKPIRSMMYLGFFTSVFGFLYAAYIAIESMFFHKAAAGWASIMVAVLILGGFQMIMLGVIGEYLWRTLDETRKRPRYIIEEKLNF